MPVTRKTKSKMATNNPINAAIQADERVIKGQRENRNAVKVEEKTALIGGKTYPSWRQHWQVEAKREGKSIIGLFEEFLIERYGLPEKK